MKHYDIIIIGNGMVGASLAAALAPHDWQIAIIDKNAPITTQQTSPDLDGRKIALSLGSQKILQHFSVWQHLQSDATAIQHVHVSAQGQFGATRINGADINEDVLGYVVPAVKLNLALQQTLQTFTNIDFIAPATLEAIQLHDRTVTVNGDTISAKLIVGADGVMSLSRTLLNIETEMTDYQQTALVSSIQLKHPHNNMAYQRFSDMGILAFLPMQNNTCGFVCTADAKDIENYMQQDDASLLAMIEKNFGYRLGKLQQLGQRYTYPLKKIIAITPVKEHFLLLGNSAHNISPVAAQGFNLALQDVYCLQQLLIQHPDDIAVALEQYQQQREPEQQRIIQLTDRLMSLKDHSIFSTVFLGLTLSTIDISNKKAFTEQAAGISTQIKHMTRIYE